MYEFDGCGGGFAYLSAAEGDESVRFVLQYLFLVGEGVEV